MPSPPVCVLEAMIAGKAGARWNRSRTASSGASRRMKSPIRATAFARDLRGGVRRRGDARYQVVHLTLLGRAEKAGDVCCLAARGAEIKRACGSLVVRRADGKRTNASQAGRREPAAQFGLWRRIMI